MTSASPSPKSPEVSEKSKKYDRQLRLWGDHGQNKLERSHICLINANATGTEILKSLILPGCGSFTVVDGHKVTQEDIGVNFFLDADSLNKMRAQCTVDFLLELNPEVSGEAITDNPETILNNIDPGFFKRFSIVIGCQLSERVLIALSKILWENGIPFLSVQTTGFLGWMRIQLNEHAIIESHPDNPKLDLRLDMPFPELTAYMKSIKIENREDAAKSPWLVLFYKALQWYIQNTEKDPAKGSTDSDIPPRGSDERYPTTSAKKREFKEHLKEYLRHVGLHEDDEGFDEALKAVNTALAKTCIPNDVKNILDNQKALKPENKFWILCAALREFTQNGGQLPVQGVLPDMTADSGKYISLQNVYRERASKDANEIFDKSCQIIKQSGKTGLSLSIEDAKLFCKESFNLKLIKGYPIFEELDSSTSPTKVLAELAQNLEECDLELMFYVILRGYLRFHKEYSTYPGVDDVESDTARFKAVVTKLLNEWNTSLVPREDCIHEICRYGAAEIPSVAAFIGGCAAHEAIKIVTGQYVPLDNTFIYNAIHCTTKSFKLGDDS